VSDLLTESRFITASLIHDGQRFLPAGTVLEVAQDGTIIELYTGIQPEFLEDYDGILMPGFVNAHCHLELSHMKGAIAEGTGLIPFLQQVTFRRNDFTDEQKKTARHEAYQELVRNGVVAVGDIANGTDTLDLRMLGELHMHTFVECIGFTETHADARIAFAKDVYREFNEQDSDAVWLRESIVPHAPYSVSEVLFKLIYKIKPSSLLSIHNQESAAENEYYKSKTGPITDLLKGFNIDDSFFKPSGKTALRTWMPWIDEEHTLMLVHNTFTSREDITYTQSRTNQPFWCLCPNANLYIEGVLPNVSVLAKATDNICIGTDSLASNHQLAPLHELLTLKKHFPHLEWEDMLCWATYNGAVALGMEEQVGSLRPGMKPGILHLPELDVAGSVERIA
jgi:cytosine/adenosine deaminase-related metal-dependent hydrolase